MKKKVRVWFNHWFSTAYHIINLLKMDENIEFIIVGSSENQNSVIKQVCDEWFVEPKFEDEYEYVSYCLEFCKKNQIDIFVPRRGMNAIGYNFTMFEQASVKVLVESNFEKLHTLNDKEKTYKLFEQKHIGKIPERYIVNNLEDFIKAYQTITLNYERACFKFVVDEGAASFRVIDNQMRGFDSLFKAPGRKITLEDAVSIFDGRDEIPKLMVMPFLSGNEVSIDCLGTKTGMIAIPRIKTDTRLQHIAFDKEFMEVCSDFFEKIGIDGPCNIQLKYHEDKLYVLEVNTRMSGGIQYSYYATGVNIPNLAVNQLLGIDKIWSLEQTPKIISYIETPIIFG